MKSNKTYFTIFSTIIIIEVLALFVLYYQNIASYFFKPENSANGELIKVILTSIGGVAIFLGLWFNNKRIKEQTRQNNISERGYADGRFNDAIKHIASSDSSIVLGGIYTLFQLAKEDSRYPLIVSKIFINYLRNYSKKFIPIIDNHFVPIKQEFNFDIDSSEVPFEAVTIINLLILNDDIFNKKSYQNILYRNMLFTDLKGFNLSLSYFYNCYFTGNVQNINFQHCKFIECNFGTIESEFNDCDFMNANLSNCNFQCMKLENSKFTNANCNGLLINANKINGCNFEVNDEITLCSDVIENSELNEKVIKERWDN